MWCSAGDAGAGLLLLLICCAPAVPALLNAAGQRVCDLELFVVSIAADR
jgi:hypothetical protein